MTIEAPLHLPLLSNIAIGSHRSGKGWLKRGNEDLKTDVK